MLQSPPRTNPFPGLRPFELDEEHLFFGREGQADELLTRLRRTRFLAVVGTSGSGKSSLVRAGLLPSLLSGLMPQASSSWRVAILRPGGGPMANLAAALNDPDVFGVDPASDDAVIRTALTESTLRRGALGLVEVVQQARMAEHESLLVVVDQFEELFRFKAQAGQDRCLEAEDEAAAFVKLLLGAVGQEAVPIFVVLTMRSDFLGDCAQFRDLPETLNDSQYLIPRLTRQQLRRAIEGPVAVGGATITPRLVNRLLNDTGDNPDQLPILQHALMRTWDHWEDQGQSERAIDIEDYEAIGSMAEALSRHADQIYAGLPDDVSRQIAETLFRRLTDRGPDNRDIRRPTPLAELCAVANASEAQVIAVIDQFRGGRRSFLMPPARVTLHGDTVMDISHESLMRNWQRLRGWVDDEAHSSAILRRLAETAALQKQGRAGYLRDPELAVALDWRNEKLPNEVWAQRYATNFSEAIAFLLSSAEAWSKETLTEEQTRRAEIRRLRAFIIGLTGLSILATGAASYAFLSQRQATEQRLISERQSANSHILAQSLISKSFLQSNLAIASLTKALETGQQIQQKPDLIDSDQKMQATTVLQEVVYSIREKNRFLGHKSSVWSASIAPNENTVVSASSDGSIKLWNLQGKQIKNLEGHRGDVWDVSFSPNGQFIASASADESVKVWDIEGRKIQSLEGHGSSVWSVSFSQDSQIIASGSHDGTVKIWSLNGDQLRSLNGHTGWVRSVVFSPNGRMIASASADATVKLWDIDGRQIQSLRGHVGTVFSVSFSSDGRLIASAGADRTIRLWSLEGGELARLEGHDGRILSVNFSPDGQKIASASEDGSVKIWNRDGQEIKTFKGHTGSVNSVNFSHDGQVVTSASSDGSIRVWSLEGEELKSLENHDKRVSSVRFSPDGQVIASASADNTVRLWERSGKEIKSLKGHSSDVLSVRFSSDGETIATASSDGVVKLWDLNGAELRTFKKQASSINDASFSPDGQIIATAHADGLVKLWNLSGSEIQIFEKQADSVNSLSFTSDGQMIATANSDGNVKLWDLNGTELTVLEGHTNSVNSVSFAPDGSMIVSASADGSIKLWNRKGQEIQTLYGHTGWVHSVSFTPDGENIASSSDDGSVKIWSITGRELQSLKEHKGSVWDISFAPDGQTIASAGEDGSIKLWNLNIDDLMAKSCDWLRDYMANPTTPAEDKALCEGYLPPALLHSTAPGPLQWVDNVRAFLGVALGRS